MERDFTIYSDEFGSQWQSSDRYHEFVNHAETYVNGQCHTNGWENFWSLLKRSIGGTYVSVEPFHLFRYVDEQAFRFHNRKHESDDIATDYERSPRCVRRLGAVASPTATDG